METRYNPVYVGKYGTVFHTRPTCRAISGSELPHCTYCASNTERFRQYDTAEQHTARTEKSVWRIPQCLYLTVDPINADPLAEGMHLYHCSENCVMISDPIMTVQRTRCRDCDRFRMQLRAPWPEPWNIWTHTDHRAFHHHSSCRAGMRAIENNGTFFGKCLACFDGHTVVA